MMQLTKSETQLILMIRSIAKDEAERQLQIKERSGEHYYHKRVHEVTNLIVKYLMKVTDGSFAAQPPQVLVKRISEEWERSV